MNYLGIDFGENKIGLALSAGEFARPYLILKIKNPASPAGGQKSPPKADQPWAEKIINIKEICEKEGIGQIVIGFPELDADSQIAQKIKDFTSELQKEIKLPIVFQDETLSSHEALEKMIEAHKGKKKRQQDDAFAAAIILQDYLDKLKVKS